MASTSPLPPPQPQSQPLTNHLNASAELHQHHNHHTVHLGHHTFELPEPFSNILDETDSIARQRIWDRFRGKGRKKIGWGTSAWNVVKSSWLNILFLAIPVAWVAHFLHWNNALTFSLCFLSIVPLEALFDYGGEQMAFYLGKDLGDLVVVTLNNAVEATLAIILLTKRTCELRLLQSTIAGVVLLHLLLVPGAAFLTGGARIWEQHLHPHTTQLNQSLLTIGVLSLLVPAAFFSSLDRGANSGVVNDEMRHWFLQMSRGMAVLLLLVYIASRIFLHDPPGENNAGRPTPNAPKEVHAEEHHLLHADPEVDSFFCVAMLLVTIGILAATAEWLVDSIEFVREAGGIQEEWFGLILLPFASFASSGFVTLVYFIRKALFLEAEPPATLAKARAIDLSIQFTLFWMPFLVLLGWWIGKPFHLLFDFYEVALMLGACFLVNYVTADSKTNWVEGFIMVTFYFMIALCTWFFPGQTEIGQLLACTSVAEALVEGTTGE